MRIKQKCRDKTLKRLFKIDLLTEFFNKCFWFGNYAEKDQ